MMTSTATKVHGLFNMENVPIACVRLLHCSYCLVESHFRKLVTRSNNIWYSTNKRGVFENCVFILLLCDSEAATTSNALPFISYLTDHDPSNTSVKCEVTYPEST